MLALLTFAAAALAAHAASPVAGFRAPAVPLFTQSPLINVWSRSDALTQSVPTHWTGNAIDMAAMVRVDGTPFLLMGDASASGAPAAAVLTIVIATRYLDAHREHHAPHDAGGDRVGDRQTHQHASGTDSGGERGQCIRAVVLGGGEEHGLARALPDRARDAEEQLLREDAERRHHQRRNAHSALRAW